MSCDDLMGILCEERDCPWYDTYDDACKSPNDPYKKECDYDWAIRCPACHKLIAVGNDDDGKCPYCGAALSEDNEGAATSLDLLEKLEWIDGYKDRWFRKKFYCPSCKIKIRTESWDQKRCFGVGTILSDNTMPRFCPNCGLKIKNAEDIGVEKG